MAYFSIENLTISFGGLKAVNDASFTVEQEEIFSIIGPNGSGKTTIFNLVTGAYRASEGSIRFMDTELVGEPPHAINGLGIARTFQTIRLWNQMSVLDNVKVAHHGQITYTLGEAFLRLPRYRQQERAIEEHAMELLRLFNLEQFADAPAASLPYGQQRLSLIHI